MAAESGRADNYNLGFEQLFAKSDLALLHDWLQETGELYMDLDRPHSGGLNNSLYFLDTLSRLKSIVSQETHPEVCIYIFRKKHYPIRGILDDALLASALEEIPDRQDFSIFEKPDEVFVASSYKHREPRILKNRTSYPRFEAEPDRYHRYIDFW